MDRAAANTPTIGTAERAVVPGRPLLSVITPVLDGDRFLPACLDSVARSARLVGGGIEHIIADGGSRDRSVEMSLAALRDPGSPVVRVIPGPDRGQSHAINRAATVSSGRWIAWLNADDRYLPEGIAALWAVLERSSASVVVGRCRFVDASGVPVFSPTPPDPVTPAALTLPLSGWFAGRCIVQPEAFVSTAGWRASGGLDESNHLTMDHDLWLRMSLAGAVFESVGVLVAEQLAHAGQKTADNAAVSASILRTCRRALERAPARFGGELAVITAELDCLGNKLRAFRSLGSPRSEGRVWAAKSAALDVLRPWMLGKTNGPVGLVGYRPDEIPAWVRARIAPFGVAVLDRASPPGSFGLVIASAPTLRQGRSGVAETLRSLRPGGVAVLAGEPAQGIAPDSGHLLIAELANRITMPGASLVGGVGEGEISACAELLSVARTLDAIPAGVSRVVNVPCPCPVSVHRELLLLVGLQHRVLTTLEVWRRGWAG